MIEKLQHLAFRIHIEPLNTIDHATKVETVIKVLSDIYHSYNNYLEIEFLKNIQFRKVYETNRKVLETIKEELSLLIVDLNFGSFEAALAPDLMEVQSPIFNDEVLAWKLETFNEYKDEIICGNYEDSNYIHKVGKRYNDQERLKIFKPLFSSFGDGKEYKLNVKNRTHEIIKVLVQPEKAKNFYIPKSIKGELDPPEYTTVQVFAKVKKQGDKINLNQKNLKEILYLEELEYDTYPYKPELIKYGETIFVLNSSLVCLVEYEDESYIIRNEELDLVVWGESRLEVEEAFSFSFYSLYLNFCKEKDENLSDEAIELKKKLKGIIKSVLNEA